MTKNAVRTLGSVALLPILLVGYASADQITIGPSIPNDNVVFKNTAGVMTFAFGGSASVGGTELKGTASYPDTNPAFGTYLFTFGSGTLPSVSLLSPHNYDITMGSAPLILKMCIVTCANEVDGTVVLEQLATLNPKAPQISGTFTVAHATGILFNDFGVGPGGVFDMNVNLSKVSPSFGVDWGYTHRGQTVQGPLSSGEVIGVPAPEPGTLALLGSGLLSLAGVLRRKLWY